MNVNIIARHVSCERSIGLISASYEVHRLQTSRDGVGGIKDEAEDLFFEISTCAGEIHCAVSAKEVN